MRFHVPGSRCPSDEFQTPGGVWYSAFRAITYDNWLIWQDALPADLAERRRLEAGSYLAITALARAIHDHHQRLPEYRRLDESPFRVGRWWDPSGEAPWDSGRRVLIRHQDLEAEAFLARRHPRCPLQVQLISTHWLELELPSSAVPAAGALPTAPPAPPGPPTPRA